MSKGYRKSFTYLGANLYYFYVTRYLFPKEENIMKICNIYGGKAPHRYCYIVPTTKWEQKVISWIRRIDRHPEKIVKQHPLAGELLYGKNVDEDYVYPEDIEVLFVMKLFSRGNLEKGKVKAAKWLRRHKLEAGYDPASGRIRVWPKE